ncbi:hypothetical protein LCGC14_3030790 [marine sediment metagenome]|uniref:Uncharacterized protein n=1 Tax=marine sediment metagenome TaxID=412755 RepID=A0A0F8XFN4_9ZZZZ
MIDLTSKKFGRLTVIKRVDKNKSRNYRWLCKCDCGKEKIILGYNLKNGHTKSCGCLLKEGNNTTHSHSKTKTYHSWHNMIRRCTNFNDLSYHNYGGRGITVCKRWRNSFENFLEDMGEPPTDSHSIDRINNNGNYCRENCQWTTRKEQNRNKRDSHLETYNGKTQCLSAWAEETGIAYWTLCARINKLGWSIEKALTTPVRKYRYGDKIT